MEKLKCSPWEKLKEVNIKPIEQECLDRVFAYLSKYHQPPFCHHFHSVLNFS